MSQDNNDDIFVNEYVESDQEEVNLLPEEKNSPLMDFAHSYIYQIVNNSVLFESFKDSLQKDSTRMDVEMKIGATVEEIFDNLGDELEEDEVYGNVFAAYLLNLVPSALLDEEDFKLYLVDKTLCPNLVKILDQFKNDNDCSGVVEYDFNILENTSSGQQLYSSVMVYENGDLAMEHPLIVEKAAEIGVNDFTVIVRMVDENMDKIFVGVWKSTEGKLIGCSKDEASHFVERDLSVTIIPVETQSIEL